MSTSGAKNDGFTSSIESYNEESSVKNDSSTKYGSLPKTPSYMLDPEAGEEGGAIQLTTSGNTNQHIDEEKRTLLTNYSKTIEEVADPRPWWRILLEVVIPFLCAGLGLIGAGLLLDVTQVGGSKTIQYLVYWSAGTGGFRGMRNVEELAKPI